MKNLFYFLVAGFLLGSLNTDAQTVEELKAKRAELQAQADALLGEVGALTNQINTFPGWKFGGVGVLGANFTGNDSWYAIENPNATSIAYGLSASGFANLDRSKDFWRTLLTFNLQQTETTPEEDAETVKSITDVLDLSSLYGYKFTPKWAASAEAKFTTTSLQFLDPGKLVASAGVTWLPIDNLVVLIHPLGYEKNWPGELVSAPGAKIGATYAASIIPGVAWSSNLSMFVPYSGGDATLAALNDMERTIEYGTGDMFNWTWINGFSTNLWKGLGVGLNIGLRQDKQLADKFEVEATGEESDNPLQMYYNLGLSYTL